jgi:hypothetical protein
VAVLEATVCGNREAFAMGGSWSKGTLVASIVGLSCSRMDPTAIFTAASKASQAADDLRSFSEEARLAKAS